MRFIEIVKDNIELLYKFVDNLGVSKESFRYYDKRNPIEAIRNHVTTLLLFDDAPLGYGHLDKDGGKIWLGICIADEHQGKGLGKIMMSELVKRSNDTINLSVDKSNKYAIKLYESYNFSIVEEKEEYYLMERKHDFSL